MKRKWTESSEVKREEKGNSYQSFDTASVADDPPVGDLHHRGTHHRGTGYLFDPVAPDESYLERDPVWHLFPLMVPPFFALPGLTGGFFTCTGWQGWYASGSRNPFGRAMRKGLEILLRPGVATAFMVFVFALVCLGLIFWSVKSGNYLGYGIAVFIVYGLWQAMRIESNAGAKRRRR